MLKPLLLLSLISLSFPLTYRFPAETESPQLKLRIESPVFHITPGDSSFIFPDTIKESCLEQESAGKNSITLRTRFIDDALIRLAQGRPYDLSLNLIKTRGKADLTSLSLQKLTLSARQSDALLSLSAPSVHSPDSVSLKLLHGKLRFDHFGYLNPSSFKAVVAGGTALLDFRGMERDLEGTLLVRGGQITLVFPEETQVTITHSASALSPIFGKGFEKREGRILKRGSGPSCTIHLEAWAGRVTLLTAEDKSSLDEMLESRQKAVWIDQIYLDEISDYIRYNRVEGLYLGAQFDSRKLSRQEFGIKAKAGYAISPQLVEYSFGVFLNKPISRFRLNLELTNGRKVDTEDEALLSAGENSLQMFLFGNDYRDFFESKYIDLSGTLKINSSFSFFGKAGRYFYRALEKKENFYLFGSDSLSIRSNPGVQAREDRFLQAGLEYKTAGDLFPRQGLLLHLKGEYAGGAIQSEFTYRKGIADVRAFHRITGNGEFSLRAFAGEVTGRNGHDGIPVQKLFDLGGLGTIRGFAFREEPGLLDRNRMLLLSSEYKYAGRLSRGLFFPFITPLINKALFIFFVDAGNAWNTEDNHHTNTNFNNLLSDIQLSKIHKSFGLGLSDREEHLRLDFMRLFRGDREKEDRIEDRVNLRFAKSF